MLDICSNEIHSGHAIKPKCVILLKLVVPVIRIMPHITNADLPRTWLKSHE